MNIYLLTTDGGATIVSAESQQQAFNTLRAFEDDIKYFTGESLPKDFAHIGKALINRSMSFAIM